MTYADVSEDDVRGCSEGTLDSSERSLGGRFEDTEDGVGVGLRLVLLVQSLEV